MTARNPDANRVLAARAALGHAVRNNLPATKIRKARMELTTAKLEQAIWEAVTDENPPNRGELLILISKMQEWMEDIVMDRLVTNSHYDRLAEGAEPEKLNHALGNRRRAEAHAKKMQGRA